MEVAVPAGITRLFAHPVLDWGMRSLTQKQLVAREVSNLITRPARRCLEQVYQQLARTRVKLPRP